MKRHLPMCRRATSLLWCVLGFPLFVAQPAASAELQQSLGLGPEIYYYHYTEPSFAHLQGAFYGVAGFYKVTQDAFSLKLEVHGAGGSLDYSSPISGTDNGITNYTVEPRLLVQATFKAGSQVQVTPYLGFGFRYLFDGQSGTVASTGAAGYDRSSNYYYMPFGVEVPIAVADGWKITPTAEYDLFLYGHQHSYLTDVPGFQNDLDNTQHRGTGFRASLMAEGKTPIGEFQFGPFVRYWRIGASNLQPVIFDGMQVGVGQEPANHTIELGAAAFYVF